MDDTYGLLEKQPIFPNTRGKDGKAGLVGYDQAEREKSL